jgi:hypothetical protein
MQAGGRTINCFAMQQMVLLLLTFVNLVLLVLRLTVLLEVVRMNLKVLFTLQLEVEFVGTKAGQIRIIPATFEEKILGARERQLLKTNCFSWKLETVDTSPATTWTSTGSPQPSANISSIVSTNARSLHSCKINYILLGHGKIMMPKGF